MDVIHLLPGRHGALVGSGYSRHPGHNDALPGATGFGHGAKLYASDISRPTARYADLAVVWRVDWFLGR